MGEEAEQSGLRSEPLHSFAISDKNVEISPSLLDPIYDTDVAFIQQLGELTVFMAPGYETTQDHGKSQIVPGAIYNRSDMLETAFDSDEYQQASEQARNLVGNARSAHYFEQLLRILYKSPHAELVHIVVGVSRSTGDTYRLLGTINPPKK